MNEQNVTIQISFSALPEGWKGTPDALLQWISKNAQFTALGAFLPGVGGDVQPTTNQGLWVNGIHLESWTGSRYEPIYTVPVGTVLDWCGTGSVAPKDYLFCDGQLVKRDEYPELYIAVGDTFTDRGETTPDPDDSFRLPNFAGRVSIGSGAGSYNPKDLFNGPSGVLEARTVGEYLGREWPTANVTTVTNAGSPRTIMILKGKAPNYENVIDAYYHSVIQPSIVMRKIIRSNRRVEPTS